MIHELLDKDDATVAENLVKQRHRQLTSRMADKAARTLINVGGTDVSSYMLKTIQARMSTESMIGLLQEGNLALTLKWLEGELPNKPRPGEFATLVAEPQDAFFTGSTSVYSRRNYGAENPARQTIAARTMPKLYGLRGHPDVPRSCRRARWRLVRCHPALRQPGDGAVWLYETAEELFGDDTTL